MNAETNTLAEVLDGIDRAVIAVSGGVDSMTLAHVASRRIGHDATMAHAVSSAVPVAATTRVREHALRYGWRLEVIDAQEFADPRYRANPVDRCYFCKTNLYGVIAGRFEGTILSGTNRDDLGDFRPGLRAAAEHGVRHPFVEAGIGKAEIRAIAHTLGLDDLAELPAAPCLSSRIETGVAIDAGDLALVESVEERLRAALGAIDLRCRIGARGVRIELGGDGLADFQSVERMPVKRAVEEMIARSGRAFLGYGPYRRGSAFLRSAANA